MRVKTGFVRHRKHLKIRQLTKGYRMTKGRLHKVSSEALIHAGQYAYIGRKQKKRNFRKLWILRINAALKPFNLSYSRFIFKLQQAKIALDRKILAQIALKNPEAFSQLVKSINK